MKRSRAFVSNRRSEIASLVNGRGQIGVVQLSEELGVSISTIRRDLDYLEMQGVLTRRYGAVFATSTPHEEVDDYAARAKKAIERTAASYVGPDETIFVSASTTSIGIVPHLSAPGVTIITNNTAILHMEHPADSTVLLAGGEIRGSRGILCGELTLSSLSIVATTKAFVGCLGLSVESGATSLTIQEVPINTQMIERSQDTYLLADSSKLGISLGFKYANLSCFSAIVTDTGVSDEDVRRLEQAGAKKIVRVNPEAA